MIKTINLIAGIEMAVELMGGYNCCIENRGSGVIYASKSSGITADSDGVIAIDSGSTKILRNVAQYKNNDDNKSYDYYGKIYLLSDSDTKSEIQTANDLNFFSRKNNIKGGGTYDDTAIKAYITDLQENKVDKETGKCLSSNDYTDDEKEKLAALENYDDTMIKSDIANKVDNDIFVAENLIKYPYAQMFESRLSVQFTYDDGMITLNGISNDGSTDTVTTMNLYTHFTLKDGQYTLSANSSSSKIGVRLYGYDENGVSTVIKTVYGNSVYVHDTTSDGFAEYSLNLRVLNNYGETEFVNDTIKPMLEIGSIAHRYQPYSLSRKAMRDDINTLMALLT